MTEIVIVAAARTPIGAFMGGLGSVPADQLGATVIKEALDRAKLDAAEVSDVILGQVLTAGPGAEPGAAGGDQGRAADRDAGDHGQPGLRLGPAGGGFGQPGDQGRRCRRSSWPAGRRA